MTQLTRRSFLRGGLFATFAGLIPISVVSKALERHDVAISLYGSGISSRGEMSIDGGEPIELHSMTLSTKLDNSTRYIKFLGGNNE